MSARGAVPSLCDHTSGWPTVSQLESKRTPKTRITTMLLVRRKRDDCESFSDCEKQISIALDLRESEQGVDSKDSEPHQGQVRRRT